MAGAKETPRQKMIGMMYLVLTALLALQVSSSVMYKFKFLEDQMDYVVNETHERNVNTELNIKAKVEERGNKDNEVEIMKKAELVRNHTKDLFNSCKCSAKKKTQASAHVFEKTINLILINSCAFV